MRIRHLQSLSIQADQDANVNAFQEAVNIDQEVLNSVETPALWSDRVAAGTHNIRCVTCVLIDLDRGQNQNQKQRDCVLTQHHGEA